jgi:hypothetical protein
METATNTTTHGWNVLERDGAILWREYKFGGGVATTFVFRGAGDGLVVLSPGRHPEASALDELGAFGKVVALVATNSYHWLGQPAWRKHFPEARSFAPVQAHDRLAKKLPEFGRFEPLEALAPLLGDRATVVDAPAFKIGNAFATVRGQRGTYWYPSDLLSNIPELPSNFVVKAVMSMTDSAPGYRLFRPAVWLQVKDKAALRAWAEGELAKSAPVAVVPAHGPPVSGADLVESTKALLAKM